MDLGEFKKQVRGGDYQRHKYWLAGVAAGILGTIAFQNVIVFVLSGVSLIGAGVTAIRGGKSAIGGIGISSGDADGVEWSTTDAEDMTPEQQRDHAYATGGFLILLGVACLALTAYLAGRYYRESRAARDYQAMAEASGLVSRAAAKGTGLAASPTEVCWSDAQTGALCSDAGLVETRQRRTDNSAHALVSTPRGLVLASDVDVSWLAASTPEARFVAPPQRLFHRGATVLTALGTRVGWVSSTDVVVADLESVRPLESPEVVAQVTDAERPLLALAPDAVLFGPTENCALEWQGLEGCAVPPELAPCAAGANEKQLVLLTRHGELWHATARARFTRVASGLRGCLLAVNERFAFVAGEGPVTRVDLGTGKHATIFHDEPALAIAVSDHSVYFRSVDTVKGIWVNAPAL